MGQKDITEKVLEDYNDVFADIINGLLFDGVQEIKPEALENTTVHAQYKAEDGKVHELERDIAKYWKEEKVELAICGIENQSKVEKNMPFRIVGYDGAAYRSQLQQERKKMLPVVTIVLYFGTDRHWNSRKKIKELMEIPRCLDTYVNDYQMHVFEVAWLTEEQISHFHSDFKVVANFFVQKRKNKDYIPDDPTEIRHVDEVLKLLQVMTGDRRYEEIFRKKKEGVHSITVSQLKSMISIVPIEDTRLLTVSVVSADPEEAKNIANTLADKAVTYLPKLMGISAPNIAEEAITPSVPTSPSTKKNVALGGILALALIVGIYTVRFLMDDTVKTAEDVEKIIGVMPLTVILEYQDKDKKKQGRHRRK